MNDQPWPRGWAKGAGVSHNVVDHSRTAGVEAASSSSLYLDDGDVRLYHGDALTVLQELPAESVHCCVTSPPFYGLRDYGTGRWEGGNPDCDHLGEPFRTKSQLNQNWGEGYADVKNAEDRQPFKSECGRCGARRVDQQIGLEDTPEAWVDSLVAVFREVRRVLRDDGTLWLEVGDSYAGSGKGASDSLSKPHHNLSEIRGPIVPSGCKPKDLIGAPWMLAFALRADGWYLRSDIVWARPNPMPESVTDRPTKSHSYVFLLSKRPRYFFDQEAVREPLGDSNESRLEALRRHGDGATGEWVPGAAQPDSPRLGQRNHRGLSGVGTTFGKFNSSGRNVRSVWNIATQPYPEAHFATFPEELARRCILAGTSERGCCPECGAPWVREVEETLERRDVIPTSDKALMRASGDAPYRPNSQETGGVASRRTSVTLGWRPSCDHKPVGSEGLDHPGVWEFTLPPVPCVVLDPFVGSGTVPYVARKHGRHAIGIDLSVSYLELAAKRLQQLSLFAQPAEPEPVAPTTRPGRSPINPYGYRGHGPKDAANPYSPYREQKGPTPNG